MNDFERLRKENTVLRSELAQLRDEISIERQTHEQIIKSFQAGHNDDTRKLREEKKVTSKLAEENGDLRLELEEARKRLSTRDNETFKLQEADLSARLLMELTALGQRLGSLHGDLMSSSVAKSLHERQSTCHDASATRELFTKLSAELVSVRSLIMAKSSIGLNGVVVSDRKEVKTKGIPSNALTGSTTSQSLDDLVHVTGPITEDAIIKVLQQRSAMGENYTRMGPVLIAVNSFDQIQSKVGPKHNQHLQRVIQTVTRKLAASSTPQVIVLSGSGGSGKTFTASAFVQQLLEHSGGASLTVIHSLGSAKTTTNSNSSRMTRVTCPPSNERNYHVFYELLFGITQEERVKLHLQGYSVQSLAYLNRCSIPYNVDEEDYQVKFEKWRTSLVTLGIPFLDVLRILVAILLLGNVDFVESEGADLEVKGNNEIKAVAALLGANGNRDALAKALYCRTVAAIVRRVNSYKRTASMQPPAPPSPRGSQESLRVSSTGSSWSLGRSTQNLGSGLLMMPLTGNPQSSPVSDSSFQFTGGASGLIGVLDMEEDILSDLTADYFDNAPCIELLTCQRAGVLTLLDKESLFARGSYQNLLQRLKAQNKDSECFFDPDPASSCFGVSHYGGNVVYDARTLLHSNRDSIADDIICVFSRQNCNFGFATHLFTNDLKPQQGQTTSPKGALHRISPTPPQEQQSPVGSTDDKVDVLLKTLVQSQPTFVRCIKINSREEPNYFDRGVVSQQIRVLQIFETLQLFLSALAHRCQFHTFAQKYSFVSPRKLRGHEQAGGEDCKAIFESLMRKLDRSKGDVIAGSWALGKRHVFFSEVVKQELENLRESRKEKSAITIQCWVRRWIHIRRSLSPSDELRVDTKTAEQSCSLFGLDIDTPPPLPKSRPYTVMGNMKMGFPQTRVMKIDYPGQHFLESNSIYLCFL
ncbi:Unconventional myosin-VIIb [Acropora cervicornis]|uniref:Unconventional myosin-VIIb n=1 Tax=Acropora cervicornis TaxID=6130 RepID=A0AAD9Q9P0_ACRCE|nr:Unconventional myosin-VIIb [Acropora cervicornis]